MFKRMICALLCLILAGSVLPAAALPVSAAAEIPEGSHEVRVECPEGIRIYETMSTTEDGRHYASPGDSVRISLIFDDPLLELVHWQTDDMELTEKQKTRNTLEFVMPDCPVTFRPVMREVKCSFTDVPRGSWYYASVVWAERFAFVKGTAPGIFSPNQPTTRSQAADILFRNYSGFGRAPDVSPFEDVPRDSWYYEGVTWCYTNGVTKGVSSTRFDPYAPLTRAQLVVMLYNLDRRIFLGTGTPAEISFLDVPRNAYYREALSWAVGLGIVSGKTPTSFRPNDLCTRAEFAAMLYRCQQYWW